MLSMGRWTRGRDTDEVIRGLKLSPGDYVLLMLPEQYRDDRSNVDRLAHQVRRSWPGLPVLIMVGEIGVAVLEREDVRISRDDLDI